MPVIEGSGMLHVGWITGVTPVKKVYCRTCGYHLGSELSVQRPFFGGEPPCPVCEKPKPKIVMREMSRDELLETIRERAEAIFHSTNGFHIRYQSGVLRGLVWAYTSEDPGDIDDLNTLSRLIGKDVFERDGKIYIR